MNYYESGDLHRYIRNDFYNIDWRNKLSILRDIIRGLDSIHNKNIIIRDFHSGNILNAGSFAVISDLGISRSINESADNNGGEIYGILTHIAPEVFQGNKFTTASDIYSFGMIMWELMTGRMPFWDRYHDTELIIEICDGFRPPIVTNAPEDYIELMQQCWNGDPNKRPSAAETYKILLKIINNENACYVYQENNSDKRKFDNLFDDKIVKRNKYSEHKNNEYVSKEYDFDIIMNLNDSNEKYISRELEFNI
ncbi:10609_t:CDS:2 [Funneliformis geosporum]|nr:10609_t:CDS:2 [Funneliformis geosporum]